MNWERRGIKSEEGREASLGHPSPQQQRKAARLAGKVSGRGPQARKAAAPGQRTRALAGRAVTQRRIAGDCGSADPAPPAAASAFRVLPRRWLRPGPGLPARASGQTPGCWGCRGWGAAGSSGPQLPPQVAPPPPAGRFLTSGFSRYRSKGSRS